MTVKELAEKLDAKILTGDTDREVKGVYTGDLLSWVISHAQSDDAWVTVMNNINVLAVASLTDVACIIIAEDAEVEPDLLERAEDREVCLISSAKGSAEIVWQTAALLGIV